VPSFGGKLKQQREQRGITLDDISASTKIGTRMLHALEEDHFEQLPGGIFNKGFIRAYARCVGLDEDQAVADYLAFTNGTSEPEGQAKNVAPVIEEPEEVEREEVEREPAPSLPWGVITVLLLVVALGFAVWGVYSRGAGKLMRAVNSNSSALPPSQTSTTEGGTSPTPKVQPSPTKVPSVIKVSTPPATIPAKTLSIAPAPLMLKVNLREDSWISITADGHESTRGTLTAPAVRSVRAASEIVVKTGNAGAVEFDFNGKKIPPQGTNGEVQTLVFDSSGWRVETTSISTPTPSPQP
jgi:cytoskeleton protein RodZ